MVKRQTLADFIRKNGRLPYRQAADIALAICKELDKSYSTGTSFTEHDVLLYLEGDYIDKVTLTQGHDLEHRSQRFDGGASPLIQSVGRLFYQMLVGREIRAPVITEGLPPDISGSVPKLCDSVIVRSCSIALVINFYQTPQEMMADLSAILAPEMVISSEAADLAINANQSILAPAIFLCYRREDTQGFARGIYESLAQKYGHEQIFRDIDSTPPGVKFSTWIESRVGRCSVMLVLIGDAWLGVKDHAGLRRLDSPEDWVRQEIEAALRRDIPIIPVRVQGARMPSGDKLPPSIAGLTSFQSAEVTDSRWAFDMGLLIQAIDNLFASD